MSQPAKTTPRASAPASAFAVAMAIIVAKASAQRTDWAHSYEPHASVGSQAHVPENFEFHFKWNLTATNIAVQIQAPTSGWIGLGLGEPGAGAMPGGDFVICTAEGTVEDRFALDYVTPSLDEQQDWSLTGSGSAAGDTWCELTRALDTGDAQDRKLDAGDHPVGFMFAYGNSDAFGQHLSTQRFTAQLRLTTGLDKLEELEAAPDLAGTVEVLNNNFAVPWNQDTCDAHNAAVGDTECYSPETTYRRRCVALDSAAMQGSSIIGVTPIIPTDSRHVLHHFTVTAYGSADCDDSYIGMFFIWAPGAEIQVFPQPLGLKVGSAAGGIGSVVMETHYNNPGREAITDNSGVKIYHTGAGLPRPTEIGIFMLGDGGTRLAQATTTERQLVNPGGWSRYDFPCEITNQETDITVINYVHHMHVAGRWMETNITRNGNIVDRWTTDFYDFNFQTPVFTNLTIKPGDQFSTGCGFNSGNRTAHPPSTPSGNWGLGSNDEMCIDFMVYYPRINTYPNCEPNVPLPPDFAASFTKTTALRVDFNSATGTCGDSGHASSSAYGLNSGQCSPFASDGNNNAALAWCSSDGGVETVHHAIWQNPTETDCAIPDPSLCIGGLIESTDPAGYSVQTCTISTGPTPVSYRHTWGPTGGCVDYGTTGQCNTDRTSFPYTKMALPNGASDLPRSFGASASSGGSPTSPPTFAAPTLPPTSGAATIVACSHAWIVMLAVLQAVVLAVLA